MCCIIFVNFYSITVVDLWYINQLYISPATYDVDQGYRQGNICDTALWLGQYHDIALHVVQLYS